MSDRAVLIGIDAYPSAPLFGCVNDVVDLGQFFVAAAPNGCNFTPYDNVRLLTDSEATTAGIRGALNWLIAGATDHDRLYFHYSGHGDQLPKVDPLGGVTALHDVICPIDYNFSFDTAISDDDFANIFAPLPDGAEFIWTSDSCHSGDLTRDVRAPIRPRDYPSPPGPMQFRIRAAHSRFGAPRGFAGAAGGFRGAFIGACQSAEKTGETNVPNHPNGVFSFALLQVLRGPTGLTMPVAAISAAVTAAIQAAGYAQTPDLKGNPAIIERKWF